MEAFMSILSDKLGTFFDLTFHHLCPSKRPPIFGEPGAGAHLGLRRLGLEGQGMGLMALRDLWGGPGIGDADALLLWPRGLPEGAQGL